MIRANVTPSNRPTADLLDGPATRVVPPRSVGTDGDTYRFAGFLQFADDEDSCWFRRTIHADPTAARGNRLELSVVEEYRDAGVGRMIPLASYSDACDWDGDGSFESVQRAVTEWHERNRSLAPGVLEE